MQNINLITPPDIIYNNSFKILIINLSIEERETLQSILINLDNNLDIYMYDNIENLYFDWLLSLLKICDMCIINLDRLSILLKTLESFIISHSHTFYMTKGENILYPKISNNRIYDLYQIQHKIGINV